MEILMIAIGVPRLHDIGRSGWIAVGVLVLEVVIVVTPVLFGGGPDDILIAGGVAVLLIALLAIWLGSIPGQPHDNKWGPPPAPGLNLSGKASAHQ